MTCMSKGRWIALIAALIVGAVATGLISAALDSDRWAPALLGTAVVLLASWISPEYFGWRGPPHRR